ncbi:MAG: GerMN domain-containing protein [Spirochaetaceae bacterium]|nr:GerMN domain-containing protein [Spirochaetaceae bacterium]
MVFFIVILLLFIIKLPDIRKTLQSTHIVERLTNRPVAAGDDGQSLREEETEQNPPVNIITIEQPDRPSFPQEIPNGNTVETEELENQSDGGTDAAAGQENRTQIAVGKAQTEEKPPETRERVIYFVKIDNSGMVFTSPVKRRVFVSDSPLLDVLNLLLQGTTDAEQEQGLTSLIPEGARIQNARVTGNTAFINFNEIFMFNSYGAEGYIAQLRQIVWTATEFPNIYDVQILIEGQRVDFLGESIRIGRPISRDSL